MLKLEIVVSFQALDFVVTMDPVPTIIGLSLGRVELLCSACLRSELKTNWGIFVIFLNAAESESCIFF